MNETPIHRPGKARPILLITLTLVVAFIGWAGLEVYFALTATPNVDADYGGQMEELAASVQGEGPNRWREYESLVMEHWGSTERLVSSQREASGFERAELDFSVVYDEQSWLDDIAEDDGLSFDLDEAAERSALESVRRAYIEYLDGWEASGFVGRLRALRDAEAVYVRSMPKDGMLINVQLPELRPVRDLAKGMRARMYLAAERGQWDEYVASARDALWLSEVVAAEPILISGLVGVAIRGIVFDAVRGDLVARRLPPNVLDELQVALESARRLESVHALQGEKLWGLDAVQHTHDSRGRVIVSEVAAMQGSGPAAPKIVNLLSIGMPRRATTEAAFHSTFDSIFTFAAMTPAEARGSESEIDAIEAEIPLNQPLLQMMVPALSRATQSFQTIELDRQGLVALCAIERYRAEHGSLPGALDALTPAYIAEVPIDAWSTDSPLQFERDDTELGYMLYSVGHDGVSDGGKRPERSRGRAQDPSALHGDAPGTDYLLTRPRD